MYCKKCGSQVDQHGSFCTKCGYAFYQSEQPHYNNPPQWNSPNQNPNMHYEQYSIYSGTTVLILAFFLGGLGIHSFYTGKTGIGIAQLITLGGCGIWAIIDIIMLVTNSFRDGDGRIVKL